MIYESCIGKQRAKREVACRPSGHRSDRFLSLGRRGMGEQRVTVLRFMGYRRGERSKRWRWNISPGL